MSISASQRAERVPGRGHGHLCVSGDGEDGMGSEKEEAEAEALFVRDLEEERIAVEKVPEGLAKFAVDATRLEDLLREKIKIRME
ncbi:hypothetical protein C0993_012321 [Termitomyces sp. T159_Od127]|nr:hypothetical protein C0993_012321 [Termitomyces sp. T159_Od127]